MRKMGLVFVAVLWLSVVALITAANGTSSARAANLACAVQVVTNWPLSQIANETIAVSVKVMNVAAVVPAASLALAQKDSNAIVSAVTSKTLARSTLIAAAAQVMATRNTVACPPPEP
jgi:hypothetical protein